jgi:hypothetical protein
MSVEDAIRSLEVTNATRFFPEGNPDKSDFDIHDYLDETMELLDAHLPMPDDLAEGATEEQTREHARRRETIEKRRIRTVKSRMKGSARRMIKTEPATTFDTMEGTQRWLIRKFANPNYEQVRRVEILQRKQKPTESVRIYLSHMRKMQHNLNKHLIYAAGENNEDRDLITDRQLLTAIIANALPQYRRKFLARRPVDLEEAEATMRMMEDAAMNCLKPTATGIDDVCLLLIDMKKDDGSRNEKKKGKRKREESSEEESDRKTDPNSKRVMKKIKAVEDSVKEVTKTINAIAWRDRRDTQPTRRDRDCNHDRDSDRGRGRYNDNGRRQDYRNGSRNGPQRCRNCQKSGHHHTNCRNPAVCFNCGSNRHFSNKCPEKESANKDKRDSYSLLPFEVNMISEGIMKKGLTYRTNARYRRYRDKKKVYQDAYITLIDKGPRVVAKLEKTKTEALIDTGASVSIVSKRLLD